MWWGEFILRWPWKDISSAFFPFLSWWESIYGRSVWLAEALPTKPNPCQPGFISPQFYVNVVEFTHLSDDESVPANKSRSLPGHGLLRGWSWERLPPAGRHRDSASSGRGIPAPGAAEGWRSCGCDAGIGKKMFWSWSFDTLTKAKTRINLLIPNVVRSRVNSYTWYFVPKSLDELERNDNIE